MTRPRKYGNKPVHVDGMRFDSKREAARWQALQLLERWGEITDLRRQVPIPLEGKRGPILTPTGRHMIYRADFVYVDCRTGRETVEDSKGFVTKEYAVKRAVLAAMGIDIVETRRMMPLSGQPLRAVESAN